MIPRTVSPLLGAVLLACVLACGGADAPAIAFTGATARQTLEPSDDVLVSTTLLELGAEYNGYAGDLRIVLVVVGADTDAPLYCVTVAPKLVGIRATFDLLDDLGDCAARVAEVSAGGSDG